MIAIGRQVATAGKARSSGLRTLTSRVYNAGALSKTADMEVSNFISSMNEAYEKVHLAYENNFWATRMSLKGSSADELTATKIAYDAFLADSSNLEAVVKKLQEDGVSKEEWKVLKMMERTFRCYAATSPEQLLLKSETAQLESELEQARGGMKLGYVDPETGQFCQASTVQLRQQMTVAPAEALRKACYDELRSIGPVVAAPLVPVVRLRNQLARQLGYTDFYDYKVSSSEGFGKARLFEILDDLERRTVRLNAEVRERAAREKGETALHPWNTAFAISGDVSKETDPYFPFEDAVDVWGRTFAALGINYRGTRMTLDLCDRPGKYSNGFCHWPQPTWRKPCGEFVPSVANFTSLASPAAVGSGKTALATLLHEGGHAAHFANIDQPSPFFSQERPPMSAGYAENQSMLLDSLIKDADWIARYARNRQGDVMPWELMEASIRVSHPYEVFFVRAMLAVCYFEKAMYEIPDDQLCAQAILDVADTMEQRILGGPSGRPLLSVPHILADESSCIYHGYVLAEMAVQQTRAHLLEKYNGRLVDNPQVGKELAETYWAPGSGECFLDLVERMTSQPLTAGAWSQKLSVPLDEKLALEKQAYSQALQEGPRYPPWSELDIGMHMVLAHGDEIIADSNELGGFQQAAKQFKEWVVDNFLGTPEHS